MSPAGRDFFSIKQKIQRHCTILSAFDPNAFSENKIRDVIACLSFIKTKTSIFASQICFVKFRPCHFYINDTFYAASTFYMNKLKGSESAYSANSVCLVRQISLREMALRPFPNYLKNYLQKEKNSMNSWINYVNESLIHEGKKVKEDGTTKKFYNVSFPCAQSKTGYASVSVSAGQVRNAVKKDQTVKTGYKNILLGDAEKVREVSIVTKKATKKNPAQYGKITMTNKEIADAYTAARDAYAASQKTAETVAAAE